MTWVGIGSLLGGVTVCVLAILYVVGGPILDGTVRSDDVELAGIAAITGAFWGAVGGAVAGLVCAAVTRALSTRGWEGARVDATVAACVVAAIATPLWVQSWETTSTDEAVRVVVLPLLVAVVVASCGGSLVGRIRSWNAGSSETSGD